MKFDKATIMEGNGLSSRCHDRFRKKTLVLRSWPWKN